MSQSSTHSTLTRPRVAIIGVGISGLSVAEVLTRKLENIDVTIVADDLSENIVSYVAAGFFFPDPLLIPDPKLNLKWAQRTYDHFRRLADDSSDKNAGVHVIPGYCLHSYGVQKQTKLSKHSFDHWMQQITGVLRPLSEEELKQRFLSHQFQRGAEYETVVANPFLYLPYLKNRFLQSGKIIERHISFESIDDWNFLTKQFDLVINCSGMGAVRLLDDHLMCPIRGQTISVHCPEIDRFYKFDRFYVLPQRTTGRVVLGGIKQFNNGDTRVCAYDRQAIWENCTRLLPVLENCSAEDRRDSVGLRPFRTQLCVNVTQVTPSFPRAVKGRQHARLTLINNYGFGGNGYTYSYGVAEHVGQLVVEELGKKRFNCFEGGDWKRNSDLGDKKV